MIKVWLIMIPFFRDHIPDWVTNEAGQVLQKQVWAELLEKLEKIQPGVVTAVIHE